MKAKIVKDISGSGLTPPQFVIQSFAMTGCTYFKFDNIEIVIWPELMYGSFTTRGGVLYFYINYWDGSRLLLHVVQDRFKPLEGMLINDLKPFVAYCLGYMKIVKYCTRNTEVDIFQTV